MTRSRKGPSFAEHFEHFSRKPFGQPLLEVDWHVIVGEVLKRIPTEELREVLVIVNRASTGVEICGLRASILNKSPACKEEGGDLGFVFPERYLTREKAWDEKLTEDADRRSVVQKLEQCSDDIMASSKARTEDELLEWEVY